MIERFKPRSLNSKILAMMILSFICALAVFFTVTGIGSLIVENYYMSSSSISARKADIYSRFSLYVSSNNIKGTDTERIAAWDDYGEYVTIFIYKDNNLNIRLNDGKTENYRDSSSNSRQYNGMYGKLYPLRFADGMYQIAIYDNTQARELMVNNISAVLVASITFIIIMFSYTQHITGRIITLSSEALEIGSGDLDAVITTKGDDEISMLAVEMDNMRNSVIERMGNERRAWEANNELITAISHDIRTPMTTLIGYLGLLNDSDFKDMEKSRQFASAAYDKAMALKDLTDELFKYFLVFGKAELEMQLDSYDGGLLLGQLLSEADFELRDMGFNIRNIEAEGECTVSADPMYLKRVVDNMVSNIKKYADREKPVVMLTRLEEGRLIVCFSNNIARSMNKVESTKIGLRTCQKIMEHMGGSFSTSTDENHFAAEFSLPINQ